MRVPYVVECTSIADDIVVLKNAADEKHIVQQTEKKIADEHKWYSCQGLGKTS